MRISRVGGFAAVTTFVCLSTANAQSICSFPMWTLTGETVPSCSVTSSPTQSGTREKRYNVWGRVICPGGSPIADYDVRSTATSGTGQCGLQEVNPGSQSCPPIFSGPRQASQTSWEEDVTSRAYSLAGFCYSTGGNTFREFVSPRLCDEPPCPPPPTCEPPPGECLQEDQQWNYTTCNCDTVCPIVFDRNGDGLSLTGAAGGVSFDLTADGIVDHLSWTRAGSDDAFLVLDRNLNGRVDDGSELFGAYTEQPDAAQRNGFRALAVFDALSNGGNGDGWITAADRVFERLRLWTDVNHDGASQPSELTRLRDSGLTAIDLSYKDANQRDEHGNLLRWRTKVDGVNGRSHWLWDVVFRLRQP